MGSVTLGHWKEENKRGRSIIITPDGPNWFENLDYRLPQKEDQARVTKTAAYRAKELKATNERQDDGAGILHQVAQFPRPSILYI